MLTDILCAAGQLITSQHPDFKPLHNNLEKLHYTLNPLSQLQFTQTWLHTEVQDSSQGTCVA
jgi:hypothetical protein